MNENQPVATTAHQRPNYLAVFLALVVLTALELGVAFVVGGLPKASILMAFALAKIMLVVLYYMHLKNDNPWYRAIFFLPFLLVIPLIIVAITQ